jgi:hypothetical protein
VVENTCNFREKLSNAALSEGTPNSLGNIGYIFIRQARIKRQGYFPSGNILCYRQVIESLTAIGIYLEFMDGGIVNAGLNPIGFHMFHKASTIIPNRKQNGK